MESKPRIKFSLLEKMEFYDDREMKLFSKIYPKIKKEDLQKYVQLSIKDMSRTDDDLYGEELTSEDLSMEGLAIRKLMEVLHREGLHCDKDEIIEYLSSLSLQPAECGELASSVVSRDIFHKIPKSIRLRPSIKSIHWMIDISYYQRLMEQSSKAENKLGNLIRILLFIRLSDGRKHAMYLKCGKESGLRYLVRMASSGLARVEASSLQNIHQDVEEKD